MTNKYRTTKTSTQRLVKALEDVLKVLPQVTYVDMESDEAVVKARKLIDQLRIK